MTGNHNLTQLHLDTALGQCQTYILLNSTLVEEHPDITLVIVKITAATEGYVYQVSKTTNNPVACLFISINLKRILLCSCFFLDV